MARERDIAMQRYEISKYRYRELKYFCLQYREKKDALSQMRGLSGVRLTGVPGGGGIQDPTLREAEKTERLRRDTELIERTAQEADRANAQSLIANVTTPNMPYEYLMVIGGRRQFYEARRKFFWLLDRKLAKMGNTGDVLA